MAAFRNGVKYKAPYQEGNRIMKNYFRNEKFLVFYVLQAFNEFHLILIADKVIFILYNLLVFGDSVT